VLGPAIASGKVIPVARDYERDGLGLFALRIPYAENPGLDSRTWQPPRECFRYQMLQRGVSTRNHYRAIWENPAYEFLREQGERDCKLAARVSREVVTLPLFSAMTDAEVDHVCNALEEVLGE
jgi:dTDP-4-amino-4,6-dideoxygalactose transaminase